MLRFLCLAFAAMLVFTQGSANASSLRYSDKELIDGFMRTVFGSENFWVAAAAKNRVSKFTAPVRVHVVDMAGTRKSSDVQTFVQHMNRNIGNLSIASTRSYENANYVVFLVSRQNYATVIRDVLPRVRTNFLERAACSGIAFLDRRGGITRAMAFVVADEGGHMFRHCMIEEILQGLGPSNDSPRLIHSIFNDRSGVSEFTSFDRYILNMLYHPWIKPGMTRNQVRQLLPTIVRDVRRQLG
ncbi:MAG: DUF2927 domain-containing protein [Pseudomonadota bacterium]